MALLIALAPPGATTRRRSSHLGLKESRNFAYALGREIGNQVKRSAVTPWPDFVNVEIAKLAKRAGSEAHQRKPAGHAPVVATNP
jgi:hypothetical protein